MVLNFLCVLAIIIVLSLVVKTSELYEDELKYQKKVTELEKTLYFRRTGSERPS